MNFDLIDNICSLNEDEIRLLIENFTPEDAAFAAKKARSLTDGVFGREVFIRGLIEISNICRNDCLYCGIRRSNKAVERYRLNEERIFACCENGYALGFRTFVLQGGEDAYFTDERLVSIISTIKDRYPGCAVTLSLGERSADSYKKLFEAGADRYLLRHETACPEHYAKLHPKEMSFINRMHCLETLKETGFQTGCGMMVGSPFQSSAELARDIAFIRSFKPQMVGIGPFIPAENTPFSAEKPGSTALTLFLISLIRLILPQALIPATTALQALDADGRIAGLNAGANVIMPNLSPDSARKKYNLYNNKPNAFTDTAGELDKIRAQLASAGYVISAGRGDYPDYERKE